MKMRALGSSGLSIAPLVFGGNVFGWTADETMSFKLLDAFVDAGFNMIDTADVYSVWAPGNKGGESETIIGKWLKKSGKRNKVLIATKVGHDLGGEFKGLKAKHIVQAVEASMTRLQIDVIDLYQAHKDDPPTPVLETLMAFDQLVRQGKVRAIGASQFSPERLTESLKTSDAAGLAGYTVLQPLYNLYDREGFEKKFAPICREFKLGVITYFSLASGFLTGKYRTEADLKKYERGDRVQNAYFNDRGLKIVAALDKVSQKLKAPMASVALAWILSNPVITAPIASATSLEQFKDLVLGAELSLDRESLEVLNEASAQN